MFSLRKKQNNTKNLLILCKHKSIIENSLKKIKKKKKIKLLGLSIYLKARNSRDNNKANQLEIFLLNA